MDNLFIQLDHDPKPRSIEVLTLDGLKFKGDTAYEVVSKMRKSSIVPSDSVAHYMEQHGMRVSVLKPLSTIRVGTAREFLTDLNMEGVILLTCKSE